MNCKKSDFYSAFSVHPFFRILSILSIHVNDFQAAVPIARVLI
jgi:hypothetical protein